MSAGIKIREGQSPVIAGTRITMATLLNDLLDPILTETEICKFYDLSPEQVAAARAYILRNPDTILSQHLRIEERLSVGNPPEVIEQARRTHETFLSFKKWLAEQEEIEANERAAEVISNGHDSPESDRFPTFREWLRRKELQDEQGP